MRDLIGETIVTLGPAHRPHVAENQKPEPRMAEPQDS